MVESAAVGLTPPLVRQSARATALLLLLPLIVPLSGRSRWLWRTPGGLRHSRLNCLVHVRCCESASRRCRCGLRCHLRHDPANRRHNELHSRIGEARVGRSVHTTRTHCHKRQVVIQRASNLARFNDVQPLLLQRQRHEIDDCFRQLSPLQLYVDEVRQECTSSNSLTLSL